MQQDMMRNCVDWFMSLGVVGLVLGVLLFLALLSMGVVLMVLALRGSRTR